MERSPHLPEAQKVVNGLAASLSVLIQWSDDRTDLTPFWRAQGIYWKARDVRDTRTFNYTYPELVGFSSPPTSQQIQGLRLKINSTYGATAPIANVDPGLFRGASASSANIATSTAAAEVESHGEAPAQRVAAVAHAPSTSGQVNLPKAPTHDIPKEYYEWVVKIVVEVSQDSVTASAQLTNFAKEIHSRDWILGSYFPWRL